MAAQSTLLAAQRGLPVQGASCCHGAGPATGLPTAKAAAAGGGAAQQQQLQRRGSSSAEQRRGSRPAGRHLLGRLSGGAAQLALDLPVLQGPAVSLLQNATAATSAAAGGSIHLKAGTWRSLACGADWRASSAAGGALPRSFELALPPKQQQQKLRLVGRAPQLPADWRAPAVPPPPAGSP